jgi:RimJ/RimL family protein N-acetyltransferase
MATARRGGASGTAVAVTLARTWPATGVRRALGREVTRLVLAWGFDVLGLHRIQLEVLASNHRAINCYLACGFRREGVRREAQLYPDGWKDFILMGLLQSEHARR